MLCTRGMIVLISTCARVIRDVHGPGASARRHSLVTYVCKDRRRLNIVNVAPSVSFPTQITKAAMDTLVSIVVLSSVVWILWKVFHDYLVTYPFDNLPGPPPTSFILGSWSSRDVLTLTH